MTSVIPLSGGNMERMTSPEVPDEPVEPTITPRETEPAPAPPAPPVPEPPATSTPDPGDHSE